MDTLLVWLLPWHLHWHLHWRSATGVIHCGDGSLENGFDKARPATRELEFGNSVLSFHSRNDRSLIRFQSRAQEVREAEPWVLGKGTKGPYFKTYSDRGAGWCRSL